MFLWKYTFLRIFTLNNVKNLTVRPSFKVELTNPCTEDLAAMHPIAGGRFCHNCAKKVVDFTALTDAEIVSHFKQSNGNVCGRLKPEQLNRTMQVEQEVGPIQVKALTWLIRAAVVAGIVLPLKARALPVIENVAGPKLLVGEPNARQIEISGTVTNAATGLPIAHAVLNFNGGYKRFADEQGRFSTTENLIAGPVNELVVEVSAGCYVKQEIKYTLPEHGQVVMNIKMDLQPMQGNKIYGVAGMFDIDKETNHCSFSYASRRDSVSVKEFPQFVSAIDENGNYSIQLPDSLTNRLITLERICRGQVVQTTSLVPNGAPMQRNLCTEQHISYFTVGGAWLVTTNSYMNTIFGGPGFGVFAGKDPYDKSVQVFFSFLPMRIFKRHGFYIFNSRWFKRNRF